MKNKLKFKLNCTDDEAAEYLDTAVSPGIEKGYNRKSGDVRLFLMREQKGLRYIEYQFDGLIKDGSLSGDIKIPSDRGDKPGLLKIILLAFMSFCVLAAVFGAIYLFALVFSRNFWLALYIAAPAFGGLFAIIATIALFRQRKKKQLEILKEYLLPIATIEQKKPKNNKIKRTST